MKSLLLSSFALLMTVGCSEGQPSKAHNQPHTQHVEKSDTFTAVVTGFGGPGSRRGWINVYFRSGNLSGVITDVRPEELNCRVGDRVPVKQSGNAIVALQGVCRKGAALPV